jgi:hypothetical protein
VTRTCLPLLLATLCGALVSCAPAPPAASASTALAPPPAAVEVRVDPRVELMSIVFRLAEIPGYTMGNFASYVEAIGEHFGPHGAHPAVAEARRLAAERGVSWDAPMSLAVHLTALPELAPRRHLEGAALDPRWTPEEAERFAALAADFAEASGFAAFFNEHRDLHALAESRMRETLREHVELGWFPDFFRETQDAPFILFIGLSNGGASYYVRFSDPEGAEEIYAVIGAWRMDEAGLPLFDETVVSTVVHELAHAYVNPLVDAHAERLRGAGESIFASVAGRMRAQSYGRWDLAVKESLVRAVVARYVLDREGPAAASRELAPQLELGFLWTEELFALLGAYRQAPDRYPAFSAFVPTLAAYFDDLGPRANELAARYDARRPRLLSISVPSGAENVDPALTEIRFHFDRAMDRRRHPIVTQGPEGQAHYPGAGGPGFDESGQVLTLPVRLRPNWSYRFTLGFPGGGGFVDTHGVSMIPVEVSFSTGEAR